MTTYDESLGLRHGNDPGCGACGGCIAYCATTPAEEVTA